MDARQKPGDIVPVFFNAIEARQHLRRNGDIRLLCRADEAAKKVARDFNLPDDWLNTGPASAVDLGLPNGVMERVTTRVFGSKLAIHFLGRYDQIHFKLYAAVDQGGAAGHARAVAAAPS